VKNIFSSNPESFFLAQRSTIRSLAATARRAPHKVWVFPIKIVAPVSRGYFSCYLLKFLKKWLIKNKKERDQKPIKSQKYFWRNPE